MAKKRILYPTVHETEYYQGSYRVGEPYRVSGSLYNYPSSRIPDEPCVIENIAWIDAPVFKAKLKITGISRGRSAAHFDVLNLDTGATYTMFMKDVMDMINQLIITNGELEGVWTFCKRGSNYGVKLVTL